MKRIDIRRLIRGVIRTALLLALLAATAILTFESVYRFQLVDTYRGELQEYNRAEDLTDGAADRPTVLFLGDSVTAGAESFPTLVRQARPDLRIINGGIPGSCVVQSNLVVDRRFGRFRPDVLVYQLNVGNDLINLRYPVNWRRFSIRRNVYWSAVPHVRSLEFLNYKSAQLVRSIRHRRTERELRAAGKSIDDVRDTSCRYEFEPFEADRYTARVRRYVASEPAIFEEQILVGASRRKEYDRLLHDLRRLLSHCRDPDCRPYLLVVPHASQVDEGYLETARAYGAVFSNPSAVAADDYPFLRGLRALLEQPGLDHTILIDAAPALRAVERSGKHAFFRYDPHLNWCGQAALAELVLDEVLTVSEPGSQ